MNEETKLELIKEFKRMTHRDPKVNEMTSLERDYGLIIRVVLKKLELIEQVLKNNNLL